MPTLMPKRLDAVQRLANQRIYVRIFFVGIMIGPFLGQRAKTKPFDHAVQQWNAHEIGRVCKSALSGIGIYVFKELSGIVSRLHGFINLFPFHCRHPN